MGGTAGDNVRSFQYNPAGQITRTEQSNDGYAWTGRYNVDRAYGVNNLNQLTSAGPVSLGYDARGNLTQSGSDAYSYSAENLLTSGPGATLSYDPLGRLYAVAGEDGATRFLYDGLDLIAEYDASGNLTERYVHGPSTGSGVADDPLVWYPATGGRSYLRKDERGRVTAVTNGSSLDHINSYHENLGEICSRSALEIARSVSPA